MDWIFDLKDRVPLFLKSLKDDNNPGFYHYSLTGDLLSEPEHWGLGNTVFAAKILYTLNLLETLSVDEKADILGFLYSFRRKNGAFYDPAIRKKSAPNRIKTALSTNNYTNLFYKQTKKAETRQTLSVLKLLNQRIRIPENFIFKNKEKTNRYLNSLNWHNPWGAGSHVSHLLFFLTYSNLKNKDELINYIIEWTNQLQSPENGSWYKGNPSIQLKINGAMKILTALKASNKMNFNYPDKLIDLCLSARNDDHACDNFNIIYVLKYANELCGSNYRHAEIASFALERLDIYRQFYFPEIGGFSFLPQKAQNSYYGARITRGLQEPDIHGTVMFLWGISIIAQIIKVNDRLGFNEQIP